MRPPNLRNSLQPERKWYNGRAAAESIKNLAWKYAQAAEPFPRSISDKEADRLFVERLKEVLGALPALDRGVAPGGRQITDDMRTMRAKPLADRQSAYLLHRVQDQIDWYTDKAAFNSSRAKRWTWDLVILEIAAAIFALTRLAGGAEFDTAGIITTAVAACVAWLQSRQHETLAQSYAVTAQELAAVKETLGGHPTEAEWAELVEEAEEAVSREHTLWRASRR